MLNQLGPDLWFANGPIVSFFGFDYPTRMAVVRLDNGDLWVWSPVALSPRLEEEVRALGPVRHLVTPNKLHHLFLAEWHERFPEAKLWGTAATVARFPRLPLSGTVDDDPPPDWAGQIDQFYFANSRFLEEAIFFHRLSRTAIIADLSQPFSEEFSKGSLAVVAPMDRQAHRDDRGTRLCADRDPDDVPSAGRGKSEGAGADRRGS